MKEAPRTSPPPVPASRRAKLLGLFLFFVMIGAMPPEALYWDGIGFLQRAQKDPIELDYGHTLYVPLLRGFYTVLDTYWYATWEYAAKVLSSAGAAVFFVMLWSRLERTGISSFAALTLAAIGGSTPILWRQAGVIEPTTWTLAALLLAANAAEAYGRERSLRRCIALAASVLVLLGFHLVSIFALPWLAYLAWGPAPRPARFHLAVPASLALVCVLVLAGVGKLGEAWSFTGYWAGFLPRFDLATAKEHGAIAWQLVALGYSGAAAAGLIGLAACVGARSVPKSALALGLPYLLALLVLGQPRVGLSIPVSVALVLLAAHGLRALAAHVHEPVRERLVERFLVSFGLPVVLALQIGDGLATGLERARTPDDLQEQAELIAAALPKDALVLSGTVAHHLLWMTNASVIALPNELHATDAGDDGRVDAVALVQAIAAREASKYSRVYITSEAAEYLEWRWGADRDELDVDPSGVIVVRADPELYLVPLVTPPPDASSEP